MAVPAKKILPPLLKICWFNFFLYQQENTSRNPLDELDNLSDNLDENLGSNIDDNIDDNFSDNIDEKFDDNLDDNFNDNLDEIQFKVQDINGFSVVFQ